MIAMVQLTKDSQIPTGIIWLIVLTPTMIMTEFADFKDCAPLDEKNDKC
jgi:hypothetical protein